MHFLDGSDLYEVLLQAFEQSFSPVVITDAELELPGPRFLYVNPAFLEMTGYTKEELEGKTPRILQGEKSEIIKIDREITGRTTPRGTSLASPGPNPSARSLSQKHRSDHAAPSRRIS